MRWALVFLALASQAQDPLIYVGETTNADVRWAQKADFDGSILFCRGHYTSDRYEANGSGWWTDYPGADQNFLARLSELTKVRIRVRGRIPFYVVVGLNDPLLFKCPILFMEDVGTVAFKPEEVKTLRTYFAKGGFLWVDDFWGSAAWDQWEREIRRVLPAASYKIFDVPNTHPLLHQLYDVNGIWQMPTIGLWAPGCDHQSECEGFASGTSERGADSAVPHLRAIEDGKGRISVLMTHNTDVADGWEEEKPENQAFIDEFSARSYAFGINVFLYALTH